MSHVSWLCPLRRCWDSTWFNGFVALCLVPYGKCSELDAVLVAFRGMGVLVIMGQEGVCRCLNHFAGRGPVF
jgi:hypothetical protein